MILKIGPRIFILLENDFMLTRLLADFQYENTTSILMEEQLTHTSEFILFSITKINPLN